MDEAFFLFNSKYFCGALRSNRNTHNDTETNPRVSSSSMPGSGLGIKDFSREKLSWHSSSCRETDEPFLRRMWKSMTNGFKSKHNARYSTLREAVESLSTASAHPIVGSSSSPQRSSSMHSIAQLEQGDRMRKEVTLPLNHPWGKTAQLRDKEQELMKLDGRCRKIDFKGFRTSSCKRENREEEKHVVALEKLGYKDNWVQLQDTEHDLMKLECRCRKIDCRVCRSSHNNRKEKKHVVDLEKLDYKDNMVQLQDKEQDLMKLDCRCRKIECKVFRSSQNNHEEKKHVVDIEKLGYRDNIVLDKTNLKNLAASVIGADVTDHGNSLKPKKRVTRRRKKAQK